jgi:di/tricarboxylate transporter
MLLSGHLQGFEKTGLGERIANKLLTVCGSNSLGLAIGLAAAEVLVCPAMPSTTSRAAGIFMPVITSVSKAAGSYAGEQKLYWVSDNLPCTTGCNKHKRAVAIREHGLQALQCDIPGCLWCCVLSIVTLCCAGDKSRKRLGAFLTQSQFQAR